MDYLIKGGNAYSVLRIELKPHEIAYAREDRICAFGGTLQFTQSKPGGFFRRIARKFSGAHLAMQQLDAGEENSWVMLAPSMMGTITAIDLYGKNLLIAKDAFFAASQTANTNARLYTMAKDKFTREHFQAIRFSGEGLVFLNAFGAAETLSLLPEQTIHVHPDYLMAWEEQLVFNEADRGFISITGPGRLWLQTREAHDFHEWLDGLKDGSKSAIS